jgi:ribosome assembly protein YihI (activator of Der GTPase)
MVKNGCASSTQRHKLRISTRCHSRDTCELLPNTRLQSPETISLVVKTDVFDFGRGAEPIPGTRTRPKSGLTKLKNNVKTHKDDLLTWLHNKETLSAVDEE